MTRTAEREGGCRGRGLSKHQTVLDLGLKQQVTCVMEVCLAVDQSECSIVSTPPWPSTGPYWMLGVGVGCREGLSAPPGV